MASTQTPAQREPFSWSVHCDGTVAPVLKTDRRPCVSPSAPITCVLVATHNKLTKGGHRERWRLRRYGGAAEDRSRPARIQSMGRQPDAGRLRAALHRQARAPVVRRCGSPIPRSARSPSWRSRRSAAPSRSPTASPTPSPRSSWSDVLIFATGLPIGYYAARYGVDIDLLTRGAGFGYIGSTITSLIYASFTFIFFAIEAVIMSTALGTVLRHPAWPSATSSARSSSSRW